MGKPIPGKPYSVIDGDTLRNLSRAAYGNDQSDLVVRANWGILASRPISDEGLPVIRKGDTLHFPETTSRYGKQPLTADFGNEVTVSVEGEVFPSFKASKIVRALNNISDGFAFETPFDYRDKKLVDALRPFGYKTVVLYIGKEPYMVARQTKWSTRLGPSGRVITVECRTKPGDMIECMNPAVSTEYRGDLLGIGKQIASVYGLKAYTANGRGSEFPDKVNKEATEPDAEFLFRIAAQQGFLVTSSVPSYDNSGKIISADVGLMFARAAVDAKPVATLREGSFPVVEIGSTYDGTKRFSSWTAVTSDNDEPSVTKTVMDKTIPILRPFVFSAPDIDKSAIEQAINWRMAKSIADSVTIPVSVVGWRNADGQLWSENMKVILYAPGAFIFEETEYLIQSVELTKDPASGDVANLALVLPEAYSLGMPVKFPWAKFFEEKKELF